MKKQLLFLLLFTGIVNAQIVNIPDANFKAALIADGIDTSGDGEIQTFEAFVVNDLHIDNSNISNLIGLASFVNVNSLYCDNNAITFLDLSTNPNINYIKISYNQLSYLNLSNNVGLTDLLIDHNNLNGINLSNNPNLTDLWIFNNNLTTLNVSSCTSLSLLACEENLLTTLDLSNNLSLSDFDCSQNHLTTLNINGLTNLWKFYCSANQLTTLNLSNSTNLQYIVCNANQLTSLNLNGLTNLQRLDCSFNNLTNLDVTLLTNLQRLDFQLNQIASIDLSNSQNLTFLSCSGNQLTTLDVTNLTNLTFLACNVNNLNFLNVSTLTNLINLQCTANQITTLDVSNLTQLITFFCQHNPMTSLDVTNLINLNLLTCGSDELLTLYMKNGRTQAFDLTSSPNLTFICCDESEMVNIQSELNQTANTTTVFNTYCSFTPGGNYNTITGTTRLDLNNNGCDPSDPIPSNIRLNINDGTVQGATFSNSIGNYTFFTLAGSFDINPEVENPSWFNFSPVTTTIPFADTNNNTTIQDFCVTTNGIHNDLEVVIVPITPARPGFDAVYKIVYKNKGNAVPGFNSGVRFDFDASKMSFVSASSTVNILGSNYLHFNYSNIIPFETREITITFNINPPTGTNPVNIGDVLQLHANVGLNIGDENPADNDFNYNQTVVGSFDPNDITCLQGASVPPSEIGNYLHYAINFENTGTFMAENVVVKDIIDTSKYDITTLQLLSTSHNCNTRITGNVVEFIFEGINLAAKSGNPPVGGHGDVLFKIKTKDDLVTGDNVSKIANIYFDYNAPIDTNQATTTFNALNNSIFTIDDSVSVYPNPTPSIININSNFNIKTIELYDVQGRLLETIIGNINSMDITNKSNGIYFVKITTDKGGKVEKVIKE